MARIKGNVAKSVNFEPEVAAPLDARSKTGLKSDLVLEATWKSYGGVVFTYVGLTTVVTDDTPENNGLYILTAENYKDINNWSRLSSGDKLPDNIALLKAAGEPTSEVKLIADIAYADKFNNPLVYESAIGEVIPKVFVDMWDSACKSSHTPGGKYNKDTGYFELNGLTDITYEQALIIYNDCAGRQGVDLYFKYRNSKMRTNIDVLGVDGGGGIDSGGYTKGMFAGCFHLEVVQLSGRFRPAGGHAQGMFTSCPNLREIKGNFDLLFGGCGTANHDHTFLECSKLQTINVVSNKWNIYFDYSPELTNTSILSIINNCQGECTFDIKLHPDAYSRSYNDPTIRSAISNARDTKQANITLIT